MGVRKAGMAAREWSRTPTPPDLTGLCSRSCAMGGSGVGVVRSLAKRSGVCAMIASRKGEDQGGKW